MGAEAGAWGGKRDGAGALDCYSMYLPDGGVRLGWARVGGAGGKAGRSCE